MEGGFTLDPDCLFSLCFCKMILGPEIEVMLVYLNFFKVYMFDIDLD